MRVRISKSGFALAAALALGFGFAGIAVAQTSTDATGAGATAGSEGAGDHSQTMFKRIDADGDGSISQTELETWRSKAIFRLDTDGDGKVTKEEVDQHMAQRQSQTGTASPDSSAFFQTYDANGDGAIDHDELKNGGDKRFQSADTDANGELSLPEWQALHGS